MNVYKYVQAACRPDIDYIARALFLRLSLTLFSPTVYS